MDPGSADPQARGVVAGLSLRHTRGHIFRAAYEGVAYGIRQILDVLDREEEPVRRILAIGGGTRGGLWTQIITDVIQRTQLIAAETIGASYGDALMGGISTGILPPETDWTNIVAEVKPNVGISLTYDRLFGAYVQLQETTRHLVADLAQFQELRL